MIDLLAWNWDNNSDCTG